ncbi:hypothetical protein ACHMW7_14615 [Aminobacter sp. UC22_36]|uniref:hypothetical protein n=1 Tax=Aminobacter sp. UC22_36 TaxID=3374549 RepID=UPI0037568A93
MLGLATICLMIVAIGWGRLVAALLHVSLSVDLQLLIGMVVVAYALALPVYLMNIPILLPAALLVAGVAGYSASTDAPPQVDRTPAWYFSMAAAAGFSLIWSLDSSARYALLAHDQLRLWLDIFIHAGTIGEFGDPRMVGRGLSGLVDTAPTFYHFVSYALPGLIVRLFGFSPVDVIAAFWLPVGIFLTSLSVFALGRTLAGLAGGALALALFALVPDAAAYGLKQGFFSFHWMMETSPGTLYALPAGLAAAALLVDWSRHAGLSRLALALGLLASTFLLRAHIFIWLVVPFAVVVVACLPPPLRRFRWPLIGLGILALPTALLWISRPETTVLGYRTFLLRFIESLHTQAGPTNYDGLYPYLMQTLGPVQALPFGLLLALGGMAGIWLLTFVAGLLLMAARRDKLEEADLLPVTLLPYACIMMTLAPTPFHGDYSDFRQRAFVLVFVLTMIWTAKFAVQLCRPTISALPAAIAACLALVSTALWMPSAKISRFAWGTSYDHLQVMPGVIEAARWIGREGQRGESIAVANIPLQEQLFDIPTVMMAVSGVPAYLSRVGLYRLSGSPRVEMVNARLAELDAIHRLANAADARQRLKRNGIGFYVTQQTEMPSWDKNGATTSLKVGTIAVWRIKP